MNHFFRYLSGEENDKKHRYNFWHGVLADYFEGVDDMDRKAEVRVFMLYQMTYISFNMNQATNKVLGYVRFFSLQ